MVEGQNQAGQVGAGQVASKDRASLDAVAAGVREAARQLSEQLEKIRSAVEQLSPPLPAEGQTHQLEEIKAAASEIERLAPLVGIAEQLSSHTQKIKDAVGQLPSAEAREPQIKAIQDEAVAMSKLVEQIKTTAEQLAHDSLPPDALKRLQKEVEDACLLLEHAIAEGSQAVSDHMIEEIKKAQKFLQPDVLPLWSDRATFEKAYRELAQALCPISAEGVRATSPLHWVKECPGLLIVLSVPFLAALFFLGSWVCSQWTQVMGCALCANQTFGTVTMLVGGGLTVFFLWGLFVFTGAATNRKLNQIIFFCYILTILSLVTSVVPFFTFAFFPELPNLMALSPINILQGCSEDLSPEGSKSAVPEEIRCGNGTEAYQWVINIGGAIYRPGTLAVPITQRQDHVRSSEEAQLQKINAEGADEKTRQSDKPCPKNLNYQWHLQGGLVVPLYVVVLSLMGSAVSMTRKVPEYQRRALDPKEPLTNAQAREYLVFQIMQVFSAPLIVVTAYYLFGPDTRAKSVLLGFASGFASEPILLAIRGLADKLRPVDVLSTVGGTAPTAVTVSPPTISLKAGESYRFTAMVTPPTANPAVTWSIDPPPPDAGDILQTGVYTAPKTITTPPTVTITAHSVADPTKSGSAIVKLTP